MKKHQRIVLSILASLPWPAIAIPAESKVLEVQGEKRTQELWNRIIEARSMLFQKDTLTSSFEDAYERVALQTGITDPEALEHEVLYYINVLLKNNLIQVEEKKLVTIIKSEGIRW